MNSAIIIQDKVLNLLAFKRLTNEQFGCFVKIALAVSTHCGGIPSSIRDLCIICNVYEETINDDIWPEIKHLFKISDDGTLSIDWADFIKVVEDHGSGRYEETV